MLAYGGALSAFCAGLWLLHGRSRLTAQVMLDTAAWSTAGILASLLLERAVRAWLAPITGETHWSLGLYATIWLGLMVVQLVRAKKLGGTLAGIRWVLASFFGFIGFLALAVGMTEQSPLIKATEMVAGPPVLNTLLVAYLLPAAVLGLGAWRSGHRRLRLALAAAACGLAAYWAFIALRHLWQGSGTMNLRYGFLQSELYSYTVAILVVGAALFYQSLARGSAPLRRAGLAVIGLAVAKVFLIDITGLTGLTRVFSLVFLGLSLAVLAWLNRWAQNRAPLK